MSTTPTPFEDYLDSELSGIESMIGAAEQERARQEQVVREFAAAYPTPNVLRAVALCEEGRIDWAEAESLFERAISDGLAAMAQEARD